MLRIAARFTVVLALCSAFGFQWIALQSIAWTAMILQNAKQTSFCEAVKQTFDGAHPCSLCHIVNKGKTSQEKRDVKLAPKIDIMCVIRIFQLLPRSVPFDYASQSYSLDETGDCPPAPPPRA